MSARIRLVMNECHHCLKYQQPNIYTCILSHFISSMHNSTTPYNYYNSAQTVNACTSCCMHCMYIIEAVLDLYAALTCKG